MSGLRTCQIFSVSAARANKYHDYLNSVFRICMSANLEIQIFSSETQLASQLLLFRAAATKTKLAKSAANN